MGDKPPLGEEEVRRVLKRLSPLVEEQRNLIGGQAVAYWAAFFELGADASELYTSADVDFEGARRSARRAGELLNGQVRLPSIDDHTPNSGMVKFMDGDGVERTVDFLVSPLGLNERDVRDSAIKANVPDPDDSVDTIDFWVMHPERSMESRVRNVITLRQQGELALTQLRRSVVCARRFSEYLLDHGDEAERSRAVLKLNERIFRRCQAVDDFVEVKIAFDIDPFDAILLDDRLSEKFRELRYPQMRTRHDERCARKADLAARAQRRRDSPGASEPRRRSG